MHLNRCLFNVRHRMKRLIISSFLALHIGTVSAQQSTCNFFVSSAGISESWQLVEGQVQIKVTGSNFSAQLFGDPSDPQPTHTLKGFIKSNRVSATLANLYSDAGSEKVLGLYVKETDPHSGTPLITFESLIAHNGRVAVGIKCYGAIQSLTHPSSGTPNGAPYLKR